MKNPKLRILTYLLAAAGLPPLSIHASRRRSPPTGTWTEPSPTAAGI